MDPVELRIRNAMHEGSRMPTGQVIDSAAPVAELLRRVQGRAAAGRRPAPIDVRTMPGGVSNTTHGEGVRRGIGYAVGFKNVGYSEGFDDYSTARVRLEVIGGEPVATVHTAAAEVGQGLVTVMAQIARTELGVDQVVNHPADTTVGSAGSTSASRQTYCTGGAVQAACVAVRERARSRWRPTRGLAGRRRWRHPRRARSSRRPASSITGRPSPLDHGVATSARATRTCSSPSPRIASSPTSTSSSGLVRLVEVTTAQDVGKALNPQAVVGQIQGGTTQGIGLALMEEIQVQRRQDPQPVLHRLPDPDDPRHPADAGAGARARRPERAVRAARRRRAADDLVHARGGLGGARSDRTRR